MMFRLSLRSTQPLIQWVSGVISLAVMWPEHDFENSSQCKMKYLNACSLAIIFFLP
jgi:hypothetical protein